MTKNTDIDKYKYSGCGIGFDRHGFLPYPSGGASGNVIIFGVDMSSSTKIDNRKKYILILGKGPTQGLEHTLKAEKCIETILLKITKKFVGTCIRMEYLFSEEVHKFKAKDSEIVAIPLCLGNISKDLSVDNMKIAGLNGHVYDFSVDYDNIIIRHSQIFHEKII